MIIQEADHSPCIEKHTYIAVIYLEVISEELIIQLYLHAVIIEEFVSLGLLHEILFVFGYQVDTVDVIDRGPETHS
jgi:hypothetical protein